MRCKEPNPELYRKFIEIYGEDITPIDKKEVKQRLQCSGFDVRNLIAHRQRQAILKAYKKLKSTKLVAEALGMTTVYVNGILSYYGARETHDIQYPQNIPDIYNPDNIITKYLFSNDLPKSERVGRAMSLPASIEKLISQLEQQPPYFIDEE